jgi:hypothetical protein
MFIMPAGRHVYCCNNCLINSKQNGLEYYDLFESDFFIDVVCHFLIIFTLKGANYNGHPSFNPWFISIDSSVHALVYFYWLLFLQIFSLRSAIFVYSYTILTLLLSVVESLCQSLFAKSVTFNLIEGFFIIQRKQLDSVSLISLVWHLVD